MKDSLISNIPRNKFVRYLWSFELDTDYEMYFDRDLLIYMTLFMVFTCFSDTSLIP